MDIVAFVWIALLVGAVIAGASFVGVLVTRQQSEAVVAVLGVGAFGLSAYSLVLIAEAYARIDAVLYAFAFMSGGVAGGWSLASTLLERLARAPKEIGVPERFAPDTSLAAVVVVACIEPPKYEPSATAGMLQMLVDEELLEPSIGTFPFLFFAQKARYRALGGTSPAAGELCALSESLQQRLSTEVVGAVDWATCTGTGRLAARVAQAAAAGHRTVVVLQLGVAESLHLSMAKRETDALRLDAEGVRVVYTDTLGSSERLVAMLTERVLMVADDPEQLGVVLVGHGQPEPRAHRNPSFDEQETAFLSRIRMRLIDQGVSEGHVRIAWAEWRAPDVTSSVRHLVALGCRRVAVLPGVFPVDTIGTRLDMELAVRQARVDDSITVVTLPAWRDDTLVLAELSDRVTDCV